ncbi:hypothetical protein [Elizabethkingia ursingii]
MKKQDKNSNVFDLINKAKSPVITPVQEEKSGVVKPITKGTYIYIEEHKLQALKKLAIDKKTTLKTLINDAIDEKYF